MNQQKQKPSPILSPDDPLRFLREEGRPLEAEYAPLFYKGQVSAWVGRKNAGKTSLAWRTAFDYKFKRPNAFFAINDAPGAVLDIVPEAAGTSGMACRAQMHNLGISEEEFQKGFSIVSARHRENRGRVNPSSPEFVDSIVNHAKAVEGRIGAVGLIIVDGFLYLGDDVDYSLDVNMRPLVENVRDVAESLNAAALILCNTLKDGSDVRGGESFRDLVDNMLFISRPGGGSRRIVTLCDDHKHKRRISFLGKFFFDMRKGRCPVTGEQWEYAEIIGSVANDDNELTPEGIGKEATIEKQETQQQRYCREILEYVNNGDNNGTVARSMIYATFNRAPDEATRKAIYRALTSMLDEKVLEEDGDNVRAYIPF